MTVFEVKRQTPSCEIGGHSFLCPVSNDEHFQLSLTEQTKPRLMKDATYVLPAGGATSETMAKNDDDAVRGRQAGTMSFAATGTE
jgi:hypothetical protein